MNEKLTYDLNQEVGSIRWCIEDLVALLENNGYKVTDDNITKLLDSRLTKTLEEQSVAEGWEILDVILSFCEDDLERK